MDSFKRRLATLERSAPGAWSIPIAIVDEDGQIVGVVPPHPLRPFDYATVAAELLAAMGDADVQAL